MCAMPSKAFSLVFNFFSVARLSLTGGLFSTVNTAYKNFGAAAGGYHNINFYGAYSTKAANVTGRILRFLKANPQKVVQMLKKELNTVPTSLKIGTGLYDPRPFKTTTLRKPSTLYHMYQNTQVSAKGARHQFKYPEKEPDILNLIKKDLILVESGARSSRKRAVAY